LVCTNAFNEGSYSYCTQHFHVVIKASKHFPIYFVELGWELLELLAHNMKLGPFRKIRSLDLITAQNVPIFIEIVEGIVLFQSSTFTPRTNPQPKPD